MSGNISFTGLNSNFDSGALIQQLVDLEIQSKIFPLEIKKQELQQENSFLGNVSSSLGTLSSTLSFDSIIRGNTSLAPMKITSSDAENEFLTITTNDVAVPQSFDIEVTQLATNTIRKSATNLSLGIDPTWQLTDVNLKGFSNINSGSVTIDGQTLDYTEAANSVLKTAAPLTPPTDIDETTILNDANFADGVSLTNGTITINGDEQTFTLDPATATVQDLLDFFEGFNNVTEASLANGRIELTGVNSMTAGTSNLVDAIGFDTSDISGGSITGSHDITEHTLADWGLTGTDVTINGVAINFADNISEDPPETTFDPNIETMNSLIAAINATSASDPDDALNLQASFNTTDNEFTLTNNIASTDPITIGGSSSMVSTFDLTDSTPGTDNALSNVLTFLESFSSVTSATLVDGRVQLSGSFQSLGSPGDDSSMLKALGLTNAKIDDVAGTVTGVQNLDAPEGSATLDELGVTGTVITINGEDVEYDPAEDTIQDLVNKINNRANTKVSAFYDILNGDIVMTNNDTGALSLTISSDGNADSIFNLDDPAGQTLGANAEFTISTLNNGEPLVSNSNTVQGLIEGVTIDITKVTTDPVSIQIEKDPTGYEQRIDSIINEVNQLIIGLNQQNDSFSRGLVNRIKNVMGSIPGEFGNDTYTSFINVGLETELDADGRFIGYTVDKEKFAEAFNSAPDELNRLLWGNDDPDSEFALLNSGNQGVFARLNELVDSYTDAGDGILKQVRDSINTQIRTQDDRIFRAEESIENLRLRLNRQFSQLDVVNAQFQQQQASLASSGLLQQG
jgi:flagellar hook-associated protein 2